MGSIIKKGNCLGGRDYMYIYIVSLVQMPYSFPLAVVIISHILWFPMWQLCHFFYLQTNNIIAAHLKMVMKIVRANLAEKTLCACMCDIWPTHEGESYISFTIHNVVKPVHVRFFCLVECFCLDKSILRIILVKNGSL